MGLFEQFPYTNFHELNDNWIVAKVKECLADVADLRDGLADTNKDLAAFKRYVLEWFDRLDLQEEVNKKLEEMAENGQLEQIIAKYIELNTAKIYPTVADMVAASDLFIEGTTARTLGYNAPTDGGGGLYRVVKYSANISNGNPGIIALLDDSLCAQLITDAPNVRQFGAVPGVADHQKAFAEAAEYGRGSVYVPDGEYIFTAPLYIETDGEHDFSIIAEPNAHIGGNVTSLIVVAKNAQSSTETRNYDKRVSITGGVWDGVEVADSVFKVYAYYRLFELSHARICNVKTCGIMGLLNEGDTAGTRPGNMNISNVDIIGADWYLYDSVGIYTDKTTDNIFTHLIIDNVRRAYYATAGGGDQLSQIHATLLTPKSLSKTVLGAEEAEVYNKTIGFYSHSGSFLVNCYSDSFSIGFRNAYNGSMTNCEYCSFYTYDSTDLNVTYLSTNAYNAGLTASGCKFRCPSGCAAQVLDLENVATYSVGENIYNRGRSPLDIEIINGSTLDPYDIGRFSNYNTNGGMKRTIKLTNQTPNKYNRIAIAAFWRTTGVLTLTLPNGWAEILVDCSGNTPSFTVLRSKMRQAATLVFHPVTSGKWVESSRLYEIFYLCSNTGTSLRACAIDCDGFFSICATCGNSAIPDLVLDDQPDGSVVSLTT